LRNLAIIAPATAASRSASAATTNGALPPSSIDEFTTRSAAWPSRSRPMPVEPVKETLRTRLSASQVPTTAPGSVVVTTLTTPAGTPDSSRIRATASAVSGVSDAGLSTTVQPAARAGPILRVAIAAGKFHGVTRAETPTGREVTIVRVPPAGDSAKSPSGRTASSANQRKNSAA
jgi:hypothetical protein